MTAQLCFSGKLCIWNSKHPLAIYKHSTVFFHVYYSCGWFTSIFLFLRDLLYTCFVEHPKYVMQLSSLFYWKERVWWYLQLTTFKRITLHWYNYLHFTALLAAIVSIGLSCFFPFGNRNDDAKLVCEATEWKGIFRIELVWVMFDNFIICWFVFLVGGGLKGFNRRSSS